MFRLTTLFNDTGSHLKILCIETILTLQMEMHCKTVYTWSQNGSQLQSMTYASQVLLFLHAPVGRTTAGSLAGSLSLHPFQFSFLENHLRLLSDPSTPVCHLSIFSSIWLFSFSLCCTCTAVSAGPADLQMYPYHATPVQILL